MVQKFLMAVAVIGSLFAGAQDVAAGELRWVDGFESGPPWTFAGGAGLDRNRGFSHTGKNNGWVRGTTGWNAVNATVPTYPGAYCRVTAYLRSNDHLTDGYMSIRSTTGGVGPVLAELLLIGGTSDEYRPFSFNFIADGHEALFYVGFWGNGRDAWIQVDDVEIRCGV